MSTEALHRLLDLLEQGALRPTLEEVGRARAEVAVIEKTACFLVNVDTSVKPTLEVATAAGEAQETLERIAADAVVYSKLRLVPVDPLDTLCVCGQRAGAHASRGPGACGPCERYVPAGQPSQTPGSIP